MRENDGIEFVDFVNGSKIFRCHLHRNIQILEKFHRIGFGAAVNKDFFFRIQTVVKIAANVKIIKDRAMEVIL